MSSGTLPIADVSKQISPALAGLNSQEPAKVSTAYAYRLTTTSLALLLSSRCDSDHKNALFCRVLQKTRRLMRNIPLTAGASSSRSYLSLSARARLGEPNRSHGMPHL